MPARGVLDSRKVQRQLNFRWWEAAEGDALRVRSGVKPGDPFEVESAGPIVSAQGDVYYLSTTDLIGDGTNETTTLQSVFDSIPAGSTVVAEPGAIYGTDYLELNANGLTLIMGSASFHFYDGGRSSATPLMQINGDDFTADRIVAVADSDADGRPRRVALVGDRANILLIDVDSEVDTPPGSLRDGCVRIASSNRSHVDRVHTRNHRRSFVVDNSHHITVNSYECANYENGCRVIESTHVHIDHGHTHTLASGITTAQEGHNGLLCESRDTNQPTRLCSFGNWVIEDCGEHAVRVASGANDLVFDNFQIYRPGAAGFKIFSGTDPTPERLTINSPKVYDGQQRSGKLGPNYMILRTKDVTINNPVAEALNSADAGPHNIMVFNSERVTINNPRVRDPATNCFFLTGVYNTFSGGSNDIRVNGGQLLPHGGDHAIRLEFEDQDFNRINIAGYPEVSPAGVREILYSSNASTGFGGAGDDTIVTATINSANATPVETGSGTTSILLLDLFGGGFADVACRDGSRWSTRAGDHKIRQGGAWADIATV